MTAAQQPDTGRGSLRDRVYENLRRRILEVELQPGDRLVERVLAEELDVSRVPLREAIRRLEADGLVLVVPRRGALVAPFTPADVRDLFDVRESLESQAIAAHDADGAAALAHAHVADGRAESLAIAERWSRPVIDPEAVAARRRRGGS